MSNPQDRARWEQYCREQSQFSKHPREMTDLECLNELMKLTRDEMGRAQAGEASWLLFGAIRGLAQLIAKRGREEEE